MKTVLQFLRHNKYMAIAAVYLLSMAAVTYWPSTDSQGDVLGATEFSAEKLPTTLPNRDLAIQQAVERGEKTYMYTTNFIPGIGMVNEVGGLNLNQ